LGDVRRIDYWLSHCGYCSRRESRFWLRDGRVTLDGEIASDPGERAAPEAVRVDGEPLDHPGSLYLAFNKPGGVVCSRDEGEGRTVFELLPERWLHRNPALSTVGRLDKETTGLLLITDDGEWLHRQTSPKHGHKRRYVAELSGPAPADLPAVFASGTLRMVGDDRPCLPARLEVLEPQRAAVELTEGRNRQVRRMFAAVGLLVVSLRRERFGEFELGDLAEGMWRTLPTPADA
jgi:16S rRNA pseudouridine516 synthase